VRLAIDHLDGVSSHNVPVRLDARPQQALRPESMAPLGVAEEFLTQGLEPNKPAAPAVRVVPHPINDRHAAGVNLEDLEATPDPVAHREKTAHEFASQSSRA
jgi:predicted glycosyltransferase